MTSPTRTTGSRRASVRDDFRPGRPSLLCAGRTSPREVVMPGTANRRTEAMDEAVRAYIDGIDPAHRPLFDRVHRLILAAHRDAAVVLSYQMPTYKVGRRRLSVGAGSHEITIYGWRQDRDGGFVARHPELKTSKGTI